MRDKSPIAWSEEERGFLVTRYADVTACLQHPALSSAITPGSLVGLSRPVVETYGRVLRRQLDLIDPPRHTVLRNVFSRAFGAAQLKRLQAFVERWMGGRLHSLPSPFNLMNEIAQPLPLAVVLELLGLPSDQRQLVHHDISLFVTALADPVAAVTSATAALDGLRGLLSEALTRSDLDEGGLVPIVRDAVPRGLDLEDVIANVILILAAGHQTMTNLIGNGALLLLAHPAQRSIVATQPDAWRSAIEEMLRFESPVQAVRRVCTMPFKLSGQPIAVGEEVVLVLGAANRDPEAFVDADRFHVLRTVNRHVAFGGGAHFCLAAQLARLQAHVALTALFSLTSLRAVEAEPVWIPSRTYRGLERLIVEYAR